MLAVCYEIRNANCVAFALVIEFALRYNQLPLTGTICATFRLWFGFLYRYQYSVIAVNFIL